MTVLEGKSLADIHTNASTTVGEETRTSCQICHASGVTPVANCTTAGCHAERAAPHGYPPAAHEADASCVLDCHSPTAGLTELKPIHDVAGEDPVACAECHTALVPAFADDYPAGWDKSCTACHTIADLHPAQAADHTGTDAAYQDASFFGNGCGPDATHTEMLSCHSIANIADLHSTMPGDGCAVCHGDGKTPAQECWTCHKPGYANTYTVPGTPSADILVDAISEQRRLHHRRLDVHDDSGRPAHLLRGQHTVDVGQPGKVRDDHVEHRGRNHLRIQRTTLPANARIIDVQIYARGKATTASPLRKMQGVSRSAVRRT